MSCQKCQGSGEQMSVLDSETGEFTFETCSRCSGSGFYQSCFQQVKANRSPLDFTRAMKAAISAIEKAEQKPLYSKRGPK